MGVSLAYKLAYGGPGRMLRSVGLSLIDEMQSTPLDAWIRPDNYVAVSGGTDGLVDLVNPSHKMNFMPQATASRPALPAESATCNGQVALNLNPTLSVGTSSATIYCGFLSDRAPALNDYLRLGTYDLFFVFRPRLQSLLQVTLGTYSPNIWDFWLNGGGGNWLMRNNPEVSGNCGPQATWDGLLQCVRITGTANGGAVIRRRSAGVSIDYTIPGNASPLTGGMTGALALGMQASLLYATNMEFCDLLMYASPLNADNLSVVSSYMLTRYAIPL